MKFVLGLLTCSFVFFYDYDFQVYWSNRRALSRRYFSCVSTFITTKIMHTKPPCSFLNVHQKMGGGGSDGFEILWERETYKTEKRDPIEPLGEPVRTPSPDFLSFSPLQCLAPEVMGQHEH